MNMTKDEYAERTYIVEECKRKGEREREMKMNEKKQMKVGGLTAEGNITLCILEV